MLSVWDLVKFMTDCGRQDAEGRCGGALEGWESLLNTVFAKVHDLGPVKASDLCSTFGKL